MRQVDFINGKFDQDHDWILGHPIKNNVTCRLLIFEHVQQQQQKSWTKTEKIILSPLKDELGGVLPTVSSQGNRKTFTTCVLAHLWSKNLI